MLPQTKTLPHLPLDAVTGYSQTRVLLAYDQADARMSQPVASGKKQKHGGTNLAIRLVEDALELSGVQQLLVAPE